MIGRYSAQSVDSSILIFVVRVYFLVKSYFGSFSLIELRKSVNRVEMCAKTDK